MPHIQDFKNMVSELSQINEPFEIKRANDIMGDYIKENDVLTEEDIGEIISSGCHPISNIVAYLFKHGVVDKYEIQETLEIIFKNTNDVDELHESYSSICNIDNITDLIKTFKHLAIGANGLNHLMEHLALLQDLDYFSNEDLINAVKKYFTIDQVEDEIEDEKIIDVKIPCSIIGDSGDLYELLNKYTARVQVGKGEFFIGKLRLKECDLIHLDVINMFNKY